MKRITSRLCALEAIRKKDIPYLVLFANSDGTVTIDGRRYTDQQLNAYAEEHCVKKTVVFSGEDRLMD